VILFLFRKFHVKKDERALLFDKGDFVDVLGPGEHVMFDPLRRLTAEKFALAATRFEHRLADFLVKAEPAIVERELAAEAKRSRRKRRAAGVAAKPA